MNEDSTYIVKTEKVAHSDTIYYRISTKDLRALYEQAFGEMAKTETAFDHLVIGFTYIPLVLIFLTLITGVNIRWNKAYKRLKQAQQSVEGMSAETKEYLTKLDLHFYSIGDRLKYFLTIWVLAGTFDTLMMLNGIFNIPWSAILASIYCTYKVIIRLVGGSALTGVNDQDLINGFNHYVKKMVVNAIVENIKKLLTK